MVVYVVTYAPARTGSYLVDEYATRSNLLAAYSDAEIPWTAADEPGGPLRPMGRSRRR